jgi:hypothetical protein
MDLHFYRALDASEFYALSRLWQEQFPANGQTVQISTEAELALPLQHEGFIDPAALGVAYR